MSLSSCSTTPGTAEADASLRPAPRAVEPEASVLLVAHVILRLSIKKEESGLREFSLVSGEQSLCRERAPLRRPVEPANAFRTQVGHREGPKSAKRRHRVALAVSG